MPTRRSRRELYQAQNTALGIRTGNPNVPGQLVLEGLELEPEPRLPSWMDMPARRAPGTGNAATREDVTKRMPQAGRGITMRSATDTFDEVLTGAYERAGEAGLHGEPEGLMFYPEEHNRIARMATNSPAGPVEPRRAITGVAVTSPRRAYYERGVPATVQDVEHVIDTVATNPEATRMDLMRPGGKALPAGLAKAKVAVETGASARELTTDRKSLKVPSFDQNLAEPYRDESRATIDTHMLQAMLPGRPASEAERLLSGVGDYDFFEHAMQQVATRRGLAVEEAQSVIWHEVKRRQEASGKRGAERVTVDAAVEEIPGQTSVFGPQFDVPIPKTPRKVKQYTDDDYAAGGGAI